MLADFMRLLGPKAPPVKVGDVVSVPLTCRYGVVVAIVEHGRRTLARVHYVDPDTGRLLECPDRPRCRHQSWCPIHGRSEDAFGLEPWPRKDLDYYAEQGMLDESLRAAAAANRAG